MRLLITMREILATPEILIGIVVLLGLLLQKKPLAHVIKGTVTAIVGFVLLTEGSNFLQKGALNNFAILFNYDFHLQGVVPNMEAISSVGITQYATEVSMIMFFGMIANICMARFGPFRYVFLTGHHTLYMASLLTVALHMSKMTQWEIILSASLMLGLLMAVMPAIAENEMRKVTGKEKIALGHFATIGYMIAAKVAYITSKKEKDGKKSVSTEEIKFPTHFSFMKDTTVEIFLIMTFIFLVLTGIAAVRPGFRELDISFSTGGYSNWIIYAIIQGASFSAAIFLILTAVRLVIAEIVPAFKGIAKKIVPHAKPAVDCPILFSYAPNAAMLGFFMSFLGGVTVMLILIAINAWKGSHIVPVILPGIVAHFFCGGSAGVFANAEGGIKGCIVGSFVHGMVITILSLLVIPVLSTLNMSSTTFSDSDFCVVGVILGSIAYHIPKGLVCVLCILCFGVPILWEQFRKVNR